jgi:hypothetical protein
MMKMMYSLSTGTPPTGESSRRRNCAPSSRFISSVISCCAETSWPSISLATSASLREDSYWPRSALRSPRSRAIFCCSSESCTRRALRSRFSTSVVPRISASCS